MLLYVTNHGVSPEQQYALEQQYIDMVQQKVDGIIGLTYNPNLVIPDSLPFVSIDRSVNQNTPCVACDNFAGGHLAAEKLADLGCKHVAFLRTGSSLINEPNKRKAGFENGCLARGLSYDMKILEDDDDLDLFRQFLLSHMHDNRLDFDGIFCVTDYLAQRVIQILRSFHLRVPEDVQIIGFDGVRLFDENYLCSTIVQPVKQIAEMCVELLLQKKDTLTQHLVCLPVTYAYGGTTLENTEEDS